MCAIPFLNQFVDGGIITGSITIFAGQETVRYAL